MCLGHIPGVAESVPLRTRRIYPSLERSPLPTKKGRGAGKTKTTDVLDSCPELPSLAKASFPSSYGILSKLLLVQLTQNITVACVYPAVKDCTAHGHRTNA